jgi:DNA-binding NtrC family response regulator
MLIGQSAPMREIRAKIEKLGRSRAAVLLLGESGTGKEVVARAIYDANPRGAFVPIDCGSLVGQLMESELFGHVRGAFTGAGEAKKGLVEMADGGTAFFDEIGDLKLEMQVKLLRLLQEREIRAVGSTARRQVDIRVIAATNRDLAREVERGNFRQDLYYRLNVITLRLPPLRERKEDIPLLVEHFLERFGGRHSVSSAVLEAVLAYDWPGNVRELQNAVERMTALNSGTVLNVPDLPTTLQGRAAGAGPAPEDEAGELPEMRLPGKMPLSVPEAEKRAILEALAFNGGDRARTAQTLGIGRTTLYRKLKRYKIAP